MSQGLLSNIGQERRQKGIARQWSFLFTASQRFSQNGFALFSPIVFLSGVCLRKLEPISSRTPSFARAERVVALYCIVRSDCVGKRTNAPRTRSRTRVCQNQTISLP